MENLIENLDIIEVYNTKQSADFLGVSTSTIYRMIKQNILNPAKTPGGQRRFYKSDLEKYKSDSMNIKAPQNPANSAKMQNKNDIVEDIKEKEEVKEEVKESKVDPRNKLNELTGTEWLPETKSFWFQKGLGSKHPHAQIEKQHPAPFSFQDVSRLVNFFTKKNEIVLDPFSGTGSTIKACELSNRKGIGIELSEHWCNLAKYRLEYEVGEGASKKHEFILGDSTQVVKKMEDNYVDLVVTSPPYWSILNKKIDHKTKKRAENGLATSYSDDKRDLGNIDDYEEFLNELTNLFKQCARVLKQGKYMCIIVSDFRNESEFVSFHSDLIQKLNKLEIDKGNSLSLQGVKVLAQNHKSLLPYGYPFAYVENIHHQYILIFRKQSVKKKNPKKEE